MASGSWGRQGDQAYLVGVTARRAGTASSPGRTCHLPAQCFCARCVWCAWPCRVLGPWQSLGRRPGREGAASTLPRSALLRPLRATPRRLPDKYLLVQRADAIRLLYVLIFVDKAPKQSARINWCTVLVVLYAGFLIGKALLTAIRQPF